MLHGNAIVNAHKVTNDSTQIDSTDSDIIALWKFAYYYNYEAYY